jgi:hypothetical protein
MAAPRPSLFFVTAGPGHARLLAASFKDVDARDKPGHDTTKVFWRA